MANIRQSTDDYVVAALRIIDEQGLEALTMRSLGEALGAHGTAVYRHFASRDELVNAVMNKVAEQMAGAMTVDEPDPRARLLSLMLAVREGLSAHPNLVSTVVNSTGTVAGATALSYSMIGALEEMGLHGRSLALSLQMIESYLVGATAFDFAGAPEHLEIRRQRRQFIGHPELVALSESQEQVFSINEEAFARGCHALLDTCATLAVTDAAVETLD